VENKVVIITKVKTDNVILQIDFPLCLIIFPPWVGLVGYLNRGLVFEYRDLCLNIGTCVPTSY